MKQNRRYFCQHILILSTVHTMIKFSKQILALVIIIVCVALSQFVSFFYIIGIEPVVSIYLE